MAKMPKPRHKKADSVSQQEADSCALWISKGKASVVRDGNAIFQVMANFYAIDSIL
jgi:hypothetical protein